MGEPISAKYRNEIKEELSELRSEVNVLTAKCKDIETSQQFLSNEFDNFKKIMHDTRSKLQISRRR